MGPDVSVVLPTFNRTRSLVAAITSVLTQSYEALELIVVDDASSEDVEGVVRGFGDPRVIYVRRQENGGAAAARNTGLAIARGSFIAFQDSDDIWLPRKLERQVAILSSQASSIGVVTGGKIIYGRDASFNYGPAKVAYAPPPETRLRLDEDQLSHLLRENRVSVQTALFRRDCYPTRLWFDERAKANEDWEFAIRLSRHTTIYEDAEPVVLGFISSDSISSSCRKQTIGLLRAMKFNKDVLGSRKSQRSLMMIDLGRSFFLIGKYRWARRFLLAALKDQPSHVTILLAAMPRRIVRTLFKPWTRWSAAKARD